MTLLFQRGGGGDGRLPSRVREGGKAVIEGLSHLRIEKLVDNTVVAATSDPN